MLISFPPSMHENDYAPALQPRTMWTEPNGEQEPSVYMPDSEHLQQQQEQIHLDSQQDIVQLPEKESDEVSVITQGWGGGGGGGGGV